MNKKQLKKIRRNKLLKKKYNKTKNQVKKVFRDKSEQDIVTYGLLNALTGEVRTITSTQKEYRRRMLESEIKMREAMNIGGLHEDDFIPHECFLCGNFITNIHDTHNPFPLINFQSTAKEENGKDKPKRCCSECQFKIVYPARTESLKKGTFKEQWDFRRKGLSGDTDEVA